MTDQKKTEDAKTPVKTHAVVAQSSKLFLFDWGRAFAIAGCLVLIVAAGGTGWWLLRHHKSGGSEAANKVQQANLKKNLTLDLSHSDNQSTIYDANQLIAGKISGKFTFSDKLLAEYYMDAAAAYENLNQHGKAAEYYKLAPKYDNSIKMAALQGEVFAGYAAGERQQLIPLLTQLESLAKNNLYNNTGNTPQHYKDVIQAIQNNKAVDL